MTVYSSHPIENGAFVTPSKMQAKDYAGGGKVYSAKVKTSDVAWIDASEGQLAKVERERSKGCAQIQQCNRYQKAVYTIKAENWHTGKKGNSRCDEDKPIFVNNAQRGIEGIKQEKATGVRWLAMQQKNEPTEFPDVTL